MMAYELYDEEKIKDLYSRAKENGSETEQVARKTIELTTDLARDMMKGLESSMNRMNLTFESARIKQSDSQLPGSVQEWKQMIIKNSMASVISTIATKDFSYEEITKILKKQYEDLDKRGLLDPQTGKQITDKDKINEIMKNGN